MAVDSNVLGVGSGGTGNSVQEYKEKAAELGSAALNRASTAKAAALDWIAAMTSSSDPKDADGENPM